jgi:parvulin-like peptidyl-prolyl isomerase
MSDADKQKVQTMIDDVLADIRTSAESEFKTADMTEEEKAEAVDARVAELREQYGYTDEYLNTMYTKQVATDKLYAQITGDIAPTEEYVRQAYDSLLKEHQTTYADDIDAYISAYINGNPPLYTPAGVRLVQQILIKLPDSVTTQITTLRSENKTDEADKLLQDELAKIKDTAQGVLDKVKDGEDFAALMKEYNEDTEGATAYPDGYPVANDTTQYYDAFTKGAMALSAVGSTSSDLVATDYGYHILRFNKALAQGDTSYEDARKIVLETAESSMKEDKWNEQVTAWKEELGIKTYLKYALEPLAK